MQNVWLQTYEKGGFEVVFEILPVWNGVLKKFKELWRTNQATKDNWYVSLMCNCRSILDTVRPYPSS